MRPAQTGGVCGGFAHSLSEQRAVARSGVTPWTGVACRWPSPWLRAGDRGDRRRTVTPTRSTRPLSAEPRPVRLQAPAGPGFRFPSPRSLGGPALPQLVQPTCASDQGPCKVLLRRESDTGETCTRPPSGPAPEGQERRLARKLDPRPRGAARHVTAAGGKCAAANGAGPAEDGAGAGSPEPSARSPRCASGSRALAAKGTRPALRHTQAHGRGGWQQRF